MDGRLTRQTAAALAGLAPCNRDSGGIKGVRHISGGRRAVRHNRIFKEIYLRLRANGKKPSSP
ncbi:MAG TPA: transposase [Candidatus Paceibacterota bacterium]|nr:transposase [Candidatus Paceibacterota bacterium]